MKRLMIMLIICVGSASSQTVNWDFEWDQYQGLAHYLQLVDATNNIVLVDEIPLNVTEAGIWMDTSPSDIVYGFVLRAVKHGWHPGVSDTCWVINPYQGTTGDTLPAPTGFHVFDSTLRRQVEINFGLTNGRQFTMSISPHRQVRSISLSLSGGATWDSCTGTMEPGERSDGVTTPAITLYPPFLSFYGGFIDDVDRLSRIYVRVVFWNGKSKDDTFDRLGDKFVAKVEW